MRTHIDTSRSLQENIEPLIERQEREYLETVLKQNDGRIAATTEQAGISRRTLLRKMKLHPLDKQSFKSRRVQARCHVPTVIYATSF